MRKPLLAGRIDHSLNHAGEGNKDYNPLRQGIAVYGDPGGFCLYVVAVRFIVGPSPYYTTGVSSFPEPEPLSYKKSGEAAHSHRLSFPYPL